MAVTDEPIPPVPAHTPMLRKDEQEAVLEKVVGPTWNRWFVSLRDKINVINESLVNLLGVTGTGLVVKNGVQWLTRSIATASATRITVTNGDGVSGNPTLDLATTGVTPGAYTNTDLTVDAYGRITLAANGSGGVGGPGGIVVTAGDKSGSGLVAGFQISAILPRNYTLSGDWFLWCFPTGSIELDVWLDDFTNVPPVVGDSIVGGNYLEITTAISSTGDYTGWTDTTLVREQAITVEIRSVSGGVKWFNLMLETT